MQYKKIVAAVLSLAMVAGIAGCDNSKKAKGQITEVMDSYVEALNNFDADAVLELTNWEDDDKEYKQIEETLDYVNKGIRLYEYEEYISSTFEVEYDPESISVSGKKATVDVEYSVVSWKKVYDATHDSYDEVLSDLKDTRKTNTVDGKVTLEQDGGEWVITKITKLDDVFEYTYNEPYIWHEEPTVAPTEPDLDPTYDSSGTAFADSYEKAMDAYGMILLNEEDRIRSTEDIFYMDGACCFYDIDGNGIPEFLYLATDSDEYVDQATLYIYTYNEYAGEAILMIEIPDIIYTAAGGGCFIIYSTQDELCIYYEHGEESLYHVETAVYSRDLDFWWSFRRDSSYNAETDDYSYEYYWDGSETDIDFYELMIEYYVECANVVIVSNFTPMESEYEYPLTYLDEIGFISYDDALDFVAVG